MTIATNSYDTINLDYKNAIKWIESLGVEFTSGRTQAYAKFIEHWADGYKYVSEDEGKEAFPIFTSSMFEILDFIDIYKSLRDVPVNKLSSIAEKLQKGVNGPINLIEETKNSSIARNYIFEVLVAAKSHRPDNSVETIFGSRSDTGVKIKGKKIWIECKRLASLNSLEANIRKACNQLEPNINSKISCCNRGIVAIDFTKILHPGDKLLVKKNDEELLRSTSEITNTFIRQCSNEWEKVYKNKHQRIIGTLVRYATMATSEERNLMVRVSEWGLIPKVGVKPHDEKLLRQLAKALDRK